MKNSLVSPELSAFSLLPELPNSLTCLTPSGPWYIVYPYVFTSGPVMSICENMSSILLFRLSKPPKRSFQMSSAALIVHSSFVDFPSFSSCLALSFLFHG